MKLKFPILTTAFAGAGLLAGAIYANAQQPPTAASPPVDPANHAAHVASGAMPPDTSKADPALVKQIADLQAKTAQLQAALASGASAGTPMPTPVPPSPAVVPPAMPMPPAASPAMGMGKMKPAAPMPGMGAAPPAAPAMAGMMPMMEKMMGMMDKMMGMGAAPMPGAPMAGMPAAPAMPPGGMGMPMMDKMMPMMDKMMGMGAAAMPPAAPMAGMPAAAPAMSIDKMEMAAMMGMGPMGAPAPGSMPQSALPGFPGASHLYHIGAIGFFLDHPQHIALTLQQQAALTAAKEQADLAKSTVDRAIEQGEQDLWSLTATDQPDAGKSEAKLAEISQLTGDKRLAFIRAVGEASKLLTDDQRKVLTGFAPPAPAAPMAAPAPAAAPMPAMKDM